MKKGNLQFKEEQVKFGGDNINENESKAKYMLSTSIDVRHIDSQITFDNYTFDTVLEFVNLALPLPQK